MSNTDFLSFASSNAFLEDGLGLHQMSNTLTSGAQWHTMNQFKSVYVQKSYVLKSNKQAYVHSEQRVYNLLWCNDGIQCGGKCVIQGVWK